MRNTEFHLSKNGDIRPPQISDCKIPKDLLLEHTIKQGVFFGGFGQFKPDHFVGMRRGTDGNIAIIGGNGSGKSSGIIKPTMTTWGGAFCATDLKGELTEYYRNFSAEMLRKGIPVRPYIVFDPMSADTLSYDPFWWLLRDSADNLISNVEELALAIIPAIPNDIQPFWVETERGVLTAALLYCFQKGLSFSESVCLIVEKPLSGLCKDLAASKDAAIMAYLGQLADPDKADTKMISNVDRGLRNRLTLFAVDPHISHAFRGEREDAECFNWDDLKEYNIFLRIPADRIEQWGRAVNLVYTQLIRYLERRPEKYSPEGDGSIQTLLLMDEFARFGKLEAITDAMSTLRSKKVNICLAIQSVAQLDQLYGPYGRRIILDNCQYQAILRANDHETQKMLCELVGTRPGIQRSMSEHLNRSATPTGYNRAFTETQEWRIPAHEFATLDDVLLLTPQGTFRIEKLRPSGKWERRLLSPPRPLYIDVFPTLPSIDEPIDYPVDEPIMKKRPSSNIYAEISTLSERTENARTRVKEAARQHRLGKSPSQDAQAKAAQRRHCVIGELVGKYFPEVQDIKPGDHAESAAYMASVETFLASLAADRRLAEQIKLVCSGDGSDSHPDGQCVHEHEGQSSEERGA